MPISKRQIALYYLNLFLQDSGFDADKVLKAMQALNGAGLSDVKLKISASLYGVDTPVGVSMGFVNKLGIYAVELDDDYFPAREANNPSYTPGMITASRDYFGALSQRTSYEFRDFGGRMSGADEKIGDRDCFVAESKIILPRKPMGITVSISRLLAAPI